MSPQVVQVNDERPQLALREAGYLYLAADAGAANLHRVHRVQQAWGADVCLLQPVELAQRFPWLNTADLQLGSLGLSAEGWFDGYALLTAFVRKARQQGARYRKGDVCRLQMTGDQVSGVVLGDGATLPCTHVVNAAGAWASALTPFPLLIDPSGFWIRPEGPAYIAGFSPADDPDDAPLTPDYGAFESTLWPLLAHRIPAFEQAKLLRAWAGYFEMNTFDHNAILGSRPAVPNLLFMNAFSGHGMQQSPIGGRFHSIDMTELLFDRILRNCPLHETNVIG